MKKFILASILFITMLGIFNQASANTPAKLTIKFATEATYPPFEYVDPTGQIQGFDIDIAKALCYQLSAECSFSNQPWASLIPSLQLGKFDALIGAMAITPERQQQVAFTDPYYQNTVSLVAPTAKNLNLSPQVLAGKSIGVQAGTVLLQYLEGTYGDKIQVKTYASEEQAFMDMKAGRIDAVLGDTPLVNAWLSRQKPGTFVIIGQPINDPHYFGPGDGIAVNKDNVQLLQQLNTALAAIKQEGTYAAIVNKYFGNQQ